MHPDFSKEFETEIRLLDAEFNKLIGEIKTGEPVVTNLNVILILFPIPSKKS